MMIALVILGFGLLVIGAALPVGLKYERDMIDRTTGQAAAEYALDLIEQNIRLTKNPFNALKGVSDHCADIFQPRIPAGQPFAGTLMLDPGPTAYTGQMWEPRIKVRPLLAVGIDPVRPTWEAPPHDKDTPCAWVERQIQAWFGAVGGQDRPYLERDQIPDGTATSNWCAPTLSSIVATYPPVFDTPFRAADILLSTSGDPYSSSPVSAAARRKTLASRVSWVAFYRRVSYAEGSDPDLYEVIAVATRRPDGCFYPWYDSAGNLCRAVAPVPTLIAFQSVAPTPQSGVDYDEYARPAPYPPLRVLKPAFKDPATLTFTCDDPTGYVLPAGSVFLPAVNDELPSAGAGMGSHRRRFAGFIPDSPDNLPVYEVVKREHNSGGGWSVTVKTNRFYPWIEDGYIEGAPWAKWAVWVIPPAFKGTQKDSTGADVPVYDDKSPILAVSRRVIRFPEVP